MSDIATPRVLFVPGYGNSGPRHWQTLWEQARPDAVRAELGNWDRPGRTGWVVRLDEAINAASAPIILVAHSLGCLAAAWWVAEHGQSYGKPIAGALLVAPPDCEREEGGRFDTFRGLPNVFLPFPSIVVASRSDPYAEFSWASFLARSWGSFLVDAGDCGHINADSGIGDWPFGARLLDRLIFAAKDRERPHVESRQHCAAL
ncbi:RBBP9/YdeN family alpha/beta hydrolase [Sphingosinicella xenopeptidilytica]|uniref:RBBP9/YdeN family alpha/beta hydrolase n=1 Tax=Sphingosinicella xenopeptidilytica TaxID=364098 RepID=A0ABW3C400_SPHXN|nr:serine hydrolase family protein [Sphingosinicella sp.]